MQFIIFSVILIVNCSSPNEKTRNVIVAGIPSDVATINPLFAFDLQEGHLLDLLFLKPAAEIWNDSLGLIEFSPMLAKNWIISKDSNCITVNIRNDQHWSDGYKVTVDDIIFSLDAYSDPEINSRLFGLFDNFYTDEKYHIDIDKTFRKNSDYSVTIFFKDYRNFSLLDINHAVLPKHAYKDMDRKNYETSEINFNPVTCGPFKLYKWDRNQKIHLKADSSSFLFNPDNVQELIFKIIPDEFSLLAQLKKGEIDLAENINTEKVKELEENELITIGSIRGRDYDYIGWNLIDPEAHKKDKIKPNKFFASAKVRKALSMAINRPEIFQAVVGKYGEFYDSPISPIFKLYRNPQLGKITYDPVLAKKYLAEEDWKDLDGDGILEKDGLKFEFKVYSNSGNSKREYISTIIKNNLRSIGVNTDMEFVEKNELVAGLLSRKYDSWLSGWSVEIPLKLDNYWSSDPDKNMLNFSSFFNPALDSMFSEIKPSDEESKKIELYKAISEIFYEYEPVTILYWTDNVIAYNKRVTNLNFSPLGLFTNAWQWVIEK